MGKASFVRLAMGQAISKRCRRDVLGVDSYKLIKKLDVGDIVGVVGLPFRTRTGELSVL